MEITISVWVIPFVLTIICLCLMFKPVKNDTFGIGAFVKLCYNLILIGFIWAIFFAIMYFKGIN